MKFQRLDGETIPTNPILIEGYAIATENCTIKCVELSTDGGETWMQAELQESQHLWAWQFWHGQIDLKNANNRVIVRAWDSAGNTQPENIRTIWNFKGYMNNSWHQIEVTR